MRREGASRSASRAGLPSRSASSTCYVVKWNAPSSPPRPFCFLGIGYTNPMATVLFILTFGVAPASAYLLAKRVGPIVPFAFIAAYVLAVGTLTFIDVVVFGRVDVKWRQAPVSAWLNVYWPLVTVVNVPSA